MKKMLFILFIIFTPFFVLSQSIKNVTTSKVYALISENGKLIDVRDFEQINYFKLSNEEIIFYKGGAKENAIYFKVLSASIEEVKGGIRLTAISSFLGSQERFTFMFYGKDIITMYYSDMFITYHNMTKTALNNFIENNL